MCMFYNSVFIETGKTPPPCHVVAQKMDPTTTKLKSLQRNQLTSLITILITMYMTTIETTKNTADLNLMIPSMKLKKFLTPMILRGSTILILILATATVTAMMKTFQDLISMTTSSQDL